MNYKVHGGATGFVIAIIVIFSLSSYLFFDKISWVQVITSGIVAFFLFTMSLYIVQKWND